MYSPNVADERVAPAAAPRGVIWLIPTLLALHNAEEAVTIRGGVSDIASMLPAPFGALAPHLSSSAMVQVLIVVSLAGFLLAFTVDAWPESHRLLWLLLALEAGIALNVVAHVAVAIFLFHGYDPGLVTAVLVNAPFAVYCFSRARRERWVSPTALRATMPAAVILHGPGLFAALWITAAISR